MLFIPNSFPPGELWMSAALPEEAKTKSHPDAQGAP
jgi:hypothetical protein